MHRNLKALGLALVAALALSALISASASAQVKHKFGVDGPKAHLTAANDPTPAIPVQTFKAQAGDVKDFNCKAVNIEKGKGTVNDLAEEVTATPIYSECEVFNTETKKTEASAFPKFEGCDYHFFGATTKGNETGGEHANVEIRCPAGKAVELTVTGLKLKCVQIPAQLVEHAVRYKNSETPTGIEDITIEATAHGIESTTLDTAACPTPSGEPEKDTTGTYTGNVTVTGFSDEAHTKPVDITVE